jgi:23S rRNA pseudouridine2605 synthase
MSGVRLQKYMAECGIASRRASEKLIAAGRVTVNGAPADLGRNIDPSLDSIAVDDRPISRDEKIYIVLNKPEGVITTAKDTHGRKTVIDCLRNIDERVFPVGRLDQDVEGVLLLTNDGELAHRLMHPSYEVKKVYLAWVKGRMMPETAIRMEKGVMLADGLTAPAEVVILNDGIHTTQIRLTLHEGRKREVKRLCEAAGHPVQRLHRVAFGGVRTRGMRPGDWRYLSHAEVASLYSQVNLG